MVAAQVGTDESTDETESRSPAISTLQTDHRTYPAAPGGSWNVGPADHARLLAEADGDHVAFWERAAERLEWAEPWHTAHTWSPARPTGTTSETKPHASAVSAVNV